MNDADRSILLVDDHAVVREGYRSVLQKQPGLTVVAEATDGAEAYRLFKAHTPDLVIMDLSLPGIGGIEAIRRIRQWDKHARVLVFTMHQNAAFAVQAIRAGAMGYVTKTSPPEVLVGMRPSGPLAPDATNGPPCPSGQKCSISSWYSSQNEVASCTSATSMSSGPTPAAA